MSYSKTSNMHSPAILAYYTRRKAELDKLEASVPGDLERIGLLLEDIDRLQDVVEIVENKPVKKHY